MCFFFLQTVNRGDADWQRDQQQTDGQLESQLRAELQQSQKQLKCAHDTQQEQKSRIESLRYIYISSNKQASKWIFKEIFFHLSKITYLERCLHNFYKIMFYL